MTTFAHFALGSTEVLDPRDHSSLAAYKASFGGVADTLWASHTFKEIPAGTKHGAKDNGDGTFTSPTPQVDVKRWDEFDFRKRFTATERKAIKAASKTSQDVEDFLDMLSAAGRTGTMIRSDDAMLNAALDVLEDSGLIAAGRKAQILG